MRCARCCEDGGRPAFVGMSDGPSPILCGDCELLISRELIREAFNRSTPESEAP